MRAQDNPSLIIKAEGDDHSSQLNSPRKHQGLSKAKSKPKMRHAAAVFMH